MSTFRYAPTAALLVAALVAGCSSGTTDKPTPTPAASDGLSRAQVRLAELAGLAARASYDATYDLDARSGDRGTIRIVAAPPSYRVDVSLRGAEPSIYIQKAGTVVSCRLKSGTASCFLVARPGEPVPEIFDPGVQRLFSDAVADLAADPAGYAVEELPSSASAEGVPPASCFDVRRQNSAAITSGPSSTPSAGGGATPSASADPAGFETGQYCFADDGLLTRLAVSTGALVLLSRGPAPTSALFDAPARPAALPDLPSTAPTP